MPRESVDLLLRAAMSAPSAGNERPWSFVVIDDRRLLDDIAEIHPSAAMVREAPAAILVCGEERLQKYHGFRVQDCSAATENILVAATASGLGAVWVGVYPIGVRVKALRGLLGIPAHVTPFALVPVGYPAESPAPSDRFDSGRVHRNPWDAKSAGGIRSFSPWFRLRLRVARTIRRLIS